MEKGNRQDGFLRVCYYAWGRSDLLPHEIDTSLCTHLILGFVEVKDNIIHKGSTSGEEAYRTMGEMKKRNPALKVMVSVGGGGNADGFHSMVASAFGIDAFTESVISTLREHGLDGIDIDWEFPNMVKHGKRHFTRLIQRLNAAFCDEARTAGKDKLLLSAAVAPQSLIIRNSYDIPEVSRCVDFINLMTYDLHLFKWYFPFSGHNAPLCARKKEVGYFSTLNVVSQFIEKGAKRVFDKQSCVPYACDGKTWVSYDDLESIEAKTRWIISEDFGGIMTFSLNYDDHKGTTTGGVTFPLHKKIKEICESPLPA
ncbi:chitinase-3-like protein 1 isoform X2 [Ornithodoros turicata]|uniref:chitinase-3-like protein 1 isoform X2 n=1 Tax=Ornithodoros turicata TaxID=34597 RepID=UPI00313A3AD4